MNRLFTIPAIALASLCAAQASSCNTAPLTTYLNGNSLFTCSESGSAVNIAFNNTLLPSYVGLNLLGSNNSSAAPGSITVTPGSPSLDFTSSAFTDNSVLLASQAELVQFQVYSTTTSLASTTFHLDNAATSAGGLGLGTGIAIGQELVCIGGSFTSLPVGLVTSVANGLLGTGSFGCNGATLVGTAAVDSGPLTAVTSVLSLPNLTGLTDTATIQLGAYNPTQIDVIKIQALLSVTGGSASTTGFGDTFALNQQTPTPEPGSLFLLAGCALSFVGLRRRKTAK